MELMLLIAPTRRFLCEPSSKGESYPYGCCAEVKSKTRISGESPQSQWHHLGRPFDQHYEGMRHRERWHMAYLCKAGKDSW